MANKSVLFGHKFLGNFAFIGGSKMLENFPKQFGSGNLFVAHIVLLFFSPASCLRWG